jgi:signal transduction histidine kinase
LKLRKNVYSLYIISFVFCLITNVSVFGQSFKYLGDYYRYEKGLGSNAVLDVIQDYRGVTFFAGINGIVVNYGDSWQVLGREMTVVPYSLFQLEEGEILVGGVGDFGYLDITSSGSVKFESLCPDSLKNNIGRVKSIIPFKQGVIFSSDKYVIKFDNDFQLMNVWENPSSYQNLYFHRNQLYAYRLFEGNFKLVQDNWYKVESEEHDKIRLNTYLNLSHARTILFGYPDGILYQFTDVIDTLNANIKDFLGKSIPFDADESKTTNEIALATRKGGILLFDKDRFILVNRLNNNNAPLTDNTTANFFDKQNSLWVASQKGASRIDYPLQWKNLSNSLSETDKTIVDINGHKRELFFSSSEGIYYYNDSMGGINKVEGVDTRIWKVLSNDRNTLALGENGLFSWETGSYKSTKLLKFFGITNGINFKKDILITTEFNGLFQVSIDERNKASFKKLSDVKGFAPSMLKAQDSSIWVSMQSDGVYRLTQSGDTLVDTKFTQKHGLPDVQEVEIIEYDEKLLFATGSGFYQLNPQPKADSSDLFIPHTSILPDRVKLNNVVEDPYHNLWVSITDENRQQHVEKLALQSDGSFERLAIPFKRLPDQEYTCIYPDPEEDSVTWIAGTAGLFRFDGTVKKDYTLPFNTLVRQVDVGDSTIFYGNYYDPADSAKVPSILLDQPDAFVPVLPYEDNSLSFHYVATSYEMPEKNRFSYYLEGFDEGWSNWTKERKKEYGNLDAGTYVFHVKSKNVYDTIGRIASYRFEILPPWYQTIWANIVFALLAAFGVWLIVMAYSYRIRVQRRKLKLIVADRTFEVLSQKREIESQNKELRYKNEEIKSQRDAIQHKNSELESYQKEILTINQQLNDLNSQLELKVEKRTSKIKTTLKRLQQTNKELDLFIYRASHDLKGPISRVNGLSTLAKLEGVSDSTLRYLELIEDTSKDMERLLSKLTQVHEIFNLTVDRSPVDIPSVFNDVRENVKSYDRGYKTKYSFDLKDEERFVSDVRLFRLIVENLVENALIFRKNDQQTENVLHEVKTQTYLKGDDFYIKIYDNGLGIDEENLPKIFEMFYRGSDQSKGSGLGLYLVYLAVEKLHGTIEVKSKRYEYTEFTIILPQHTRSLV